MKAKSKSPRIVIGWREWVGLPELGVQKIKAKIDTGARSSALHAWNIEAFEDDGAEWVRFDLHPLQRTDSLIISVVAPLSRRKDVKSSNGQIETRYAIKTKILIGDVKASTELSLTNRDEMGFRMLIGRTAMAKKFLISPDQSFLAGPPHASAGMQHLK